MFRLFFPKTRVTAEHEWGVVGGNDVVSGVIHHYQTLSMYHITVMKQWDSIYIQVSSSLEHYTSAEVRGLSFWFQELGQQLFISGV